LEVAARLEKNERYEIALKISAHLPQGALWLREQLVVPVRCHLKDIPMNSFEISGLELDPLRERGSNEDCVS